MNSTEIKVNVPAWEQDSEFVRVVSGFVAVDPDDFTDKPRYVFRDGHMVLKDEN